MGDAVEMLKSDSRWVLRGELVVWVVKITWRLWRKAGLDRELVQIFFNFEQQAAANNG